MDDLKIGVLSQLISDHIGHMVELTLSRDDGAVVIYEMSALPQEVCNTLVPDHDPGTMSGSVWIYAPLDEEDPVEAQISFSYKKAGETKGLTIFSRVREDEGWGPITQA